MTGVVMRTVWSWSCSAALVCASASVCFAQSAANELVPIANTGASAPAFAGTTYGALGQPAIGKDGTLVFAAEFRDATPIARHAYLFGHPGDLRPLLQVGDSVPRADFVGTSYTLVSGSPQIAALGVSADGVAAVTHNLAGSVGLITIDPNGSPHAQIRVGDSVGGAGAVVAPIPALMMGTGSETAFVSSLKGASGGANIPTAWRLKDGVATVAAQKGAAVFGGGGDIFGAFGESAFVSNGDLLFVNTTANGRSIFRNSGGPSVRLFALSTPLGPVSPGTQLDGTTGLLVPSFDANARGDVVFASDYVPTCTAQPSGPPLCMGETGSGLFVLSSGGAFRRILRAGDPAPGIGGGVTIHSFAFTGDMSGSWFLIDAAGRVLFEVALEGTGVQSQNAKALYLADGGTITLIARAGDPAPGMAPGTRYGTTFRASFGAAGQIVFRAATTGAATATAALWARRPTGATTLLTYVGDTVLGSVVSNLYIALGSGGEDGRPSCFATSTPDGPLYFTVERNTAGVLEQAIVEWGGIAINDAGDAPDADPSDGVPDTNLAQSGLQVTLRAAIEWANATGKAQNLQFRIPGTTPVTISPGGPLPAATVPLTLDASTNPSHVTLDGASAGTGAVGLRLTGAGSLVRGLTVRRFGSHGIEYSGPNVDGSALIVERIESDHNLGWGLRSTGRLEVDRRAVTSAQSSSIHDNGAGVKKAGGIFAAGDLFARNIRVEKNAGPGVATRGRADLAATAGASIELNHNAGNGCQAMEINLTGEATQVVALHATSNGNNGLESLGAVSLLTPVDISDNAGFGVRADGDVSINWAASAMTNAGASTIARNGNAATPIGVSSTDLQSQSEVLHAIVPSALASGGVVSLAGSIRLASMAVDANKGLGVAAAGDVTIHCTASVACEVSDNRGTGITALGLVTVTGSGSSALRSQRNHGHGIHAGRKTVADDELGLNASCRVEITDNTFVGLWSDGAVTLTLATPPAGQPGNLIARNGRGPDAWDAAGSIDRLGDPLPRASGSLVRGGGVLVSHEGLQASALMVTDNADAGIAAAGNVWLSGPVTITHNTGPGVVAYGGFTWSDAKAKLEVASNTGHGIQARSGAHTNTFGVIAATDIRGQALLHDNAGWGIMSERGDVLIASICDAAGEAMCTHVERNGASGGAYIITDQTLLAQAPVTHAGTSEPPRGGLHTESGTVSLSRGTVERNASFGIEAAPGGLKLVSSRVCNNGGRNVATTIPPESTDSMICADGTIDGTSQEATPGAAGDSADDCSCRAVGRSQRPMMSALLALAAGIATCARRRARSRASNGPGRVVE